MFLFTSDILAQDPLKESEMEAMIKQLLSGTVPYLLDYFMDNKHLLVQFLRDEALKTDNAIDDAIVDILEAWLDTL